MKKIIVAALTLMLIFTVSVPAFADGDLAVSLPVVNANPGESISVPITISGLSAATLTVTYDASRLTYEGYSDTVGLAVVNDTNPGTLTIAIINAMDNYNNEACMKLNFTAASNAAGEVALDLAVTDGSRLVDNKTTSVSGDDVNASGGKVVLPGQHNTTAPESTGTPDASKEYTVTFVDGVTDQTLKTETVRGGSGATPPEPPEHEGYTFVRWDDGYQSVAADVTIKANYKATTYTVVFMGGYNNQAITTQSVNHGSDAVLPKLNVHDGFTFTGWDTDHKNVTQNLIITAQYEEAAANGIKVTVTSNEGGSVIPSGTMYVESGGELKLDFITSDGYAAAKVIINGETAAENPGSSYTVSNVNEELTIEVVFENENSQQTPSGTEAVGPGAPDPEGGSYTWLIIAGAAVVAAGIVVGIIVWRKKSA